MQCYANIFLMLTESIMSKYFNKNGIININVMQMKKKHLNKTKNICSYLGI